MLKRLLGEVGTALRLMPMMAMEMQRMSAKMNVMTYSVGRTMGAMIRPCGPLAGDKTSPASGRFDGQ